MDVVYCDICGAPADDNGHERCAVARTMEPPRYCPACRRRMTVQVTPAGWHARCSRHGEHTGGAGTASGA